ncbi:MAG: hypothetical protein Q7T20_08790 [Saprospiraceae bacterium]|nr:hypothetical protein [Saprospiraceae bacterium]
MKNITSFKKVCFTILLHFSMLAGPSLSAQDWSDFDILLSQMDSMQRIEYLNNLSTLLNITNQSTYNFNSALDSLNATLYGPNPADPAIEAMLPSDSVLSIYLSSYLGGSNFGTEDSLSFMGELDIFNGVWNAENDSLYNSFDSYQNLINSPPVLPNTYPGSTWHENVGALISNQGSTFLTTPALGAGGIEGLLDKLFDPTLFNRFEIFAGIQHAKTNYYGLSETVTAPVFGVRTVEHFKSEWEPRWRVQSSWFNNETGVIDNETITQQNTGFSPFIINGSFEIMYNPNLVPGSSGVPVRLLTMLGIEAGTYVPAHRNPSYPASLNNEGFTTGWGPVIGTGVSSTMGDLTIYALGTVAYGDVINGPNAIISNYRWRSNRLEAGILYANAVTVRYENTLSSNWAFDGNKHARFHQVTVGLPTTGLFR